MPLCTVQSIVQSYWRSLGTSPRQTFESCSTVRVLDAWWKEHFESVAMTRARKEGRTNKSVSTLRWAARRDGQLWSWTHFNGYIRSCNCGCHVKVSYLCGRGLGFGSLGWNLPRVPTMSKETEYVARSHDEKVIIQYAMRYCIWLSKDNRLNWSNCLFH